MYVFQFYITISFTTFSQARTDDIAQTSYDVCIRRGIGSTLVLFFESSTLRHDRSVRAACITAQYAAQRGVLFLCADS